MTETLEETRAALLARIEKPEETETLTQQSGATTAAAVRSCVGGGCDD